MNNNDIPRSWQDRCSGDGHKRYVDSNGVHRYTDNDEPVGESQYRPCAKCGQFPNEDGDDYCISNLGRVMNACCGHGVNKGYVQFDNGIIIRGYFEIEKSNKNYNLEYEIRSREEILNKIKELESGIIDSDKIALQTLKWVMRYSS